MIIAIDGPAAAGKGTLAQNLAKHLNYAFLDTGRLYRAVGFEVIQKNKGVFDEKIAIQAAKEFDPKNINKILNNPALREEATGKMASEVAVVPDVRAALLDLQRDFAKNPFFENGKPAKGSVLDGRDIGTAVCPEAEVKFFVTASAEVRADRRFKELTDAGKTGDYDKILADIKERDERDSNRAAAPLKPADDAIILDTSNLNAELVFQKALDLIALNHE